MLRHKMTISGILILVISILLGIVVNIVGMAYMDTAVDSAAINGISTVTTLIERMFLVTLFSIVGAILGIVLIIVGAIKANKN